MSKYITYQGDKNVEQNKENYKSQGGENSLTGFNIP